MKETISNAGDFAVQRWSREAVEQTRTYVVQKSAVQRHGDAPRLEKRELPKWESNKTAKVK